MATQAKYAAESHAELDEAVAIDPSLEKRFDNLCYDQRHWIVLSIEANCCQYLNDVHAGKTPDFESEEDCIIASAEASYQDVISNTDWQD